MPASSEFTWATAAYRPPIFQVYGTKRKASSGPNEMESDDVTTQEITKRQCIWDGSAITDHVNDVHNTNFTQTNAEEMDSGNHEQQVPNVHHLEKVHPQLQLVHQVHAQRSPSPRPSPWKTPLTPPFPTSHHALAPQQHQQRVGADMESAIQFHHHGSNPHLSRQQQVTAQSPLSEQQQQQVLCDDYSQICQTDDHIMDLNEEVYDVSAAAQAAQLAMDSDFVPNPQQYSTTTYDDAMDKIIASPVQEFGSPSLVKCLCRPSWEGYLSSKPYVSDYY